MICKDCIHFDVCKDATVPNPEYKGVQPDKSKECRHFKNKADYAEVKRGEWLLLITRSDYLEPPSCDTAKCLICGFKIDVSETTFNYCPNCGAKMDGKGDT